MLHGLKLPKRTPKRKPDAGRWKQSGAFRFRGSEARLWEDFSLKIQVPESSTIAIDLGRRPAAGLNLTVLET